MKVALIGAPNCGKSTLFNRLTGGNAHTGNRAGVTVALSRGILNGCPDVELLDLPGIYSATPGFADEKVAWNELEREKPDLVLFIADGTQISRSLPLFHYICGRYPTALAVNMCDELRRAGIPLDEKGLANCLGVPVFAISAKNGDGTDALQMYLQSLREPGAFALRAGSCARCNSRECVARMKCKDVLRALPPPTPRHAGQTFADKLFLSPFPGILCLLFFLGGILFLSFGPVGDLLSDGFSRLLLSPLCTVASPLADKIPRFWYAFLTEGVLAGAGAVLSFLPRLFLLFALLTVLEDSGYLARASALTSPVLGFFGLSGDAAVPLLLGIGCSVPAVLSTRHIRDTGTRKLSRLLLPFLPCSARLPVIAALAGLFFATPFFGKSIPVLAGTVLFLFLAFALSRRYRPGLFAGELPRYRLPDVRNVLRVAGRRTRHFLSRAGSVILLASALLWLLSHLTPAGAACTNADRSLLAMAAGWIAPVFRPVGFGNWQSVAALAAGVAAKETALSALTVFCNGDLAELVSLLSPAGALSFLTFFATYTPCAATLAAIRREGGLKSLAASLVLSFAGAYAAAFVVFHTAVLLG